MKCYVGVNRIANQHRAVLEIRQIGMLPNHQGFAFGNPGTCGLSEQLRFYPAEIDIVVIPHLISDQSEDHTRRMCFKIDSTPVTLILTHLA